MLQRDDIDAVIVDAPSRMHRDVITAAARAGKHIFTEKVLAPTLKEVNEIIAEVEQSGVKSGAIGIVDAGFVNSFSPFTIEIHGTEGTLMYGTPDEKLVLRTSCGDKSLAEGWNVQSLPADRESAFHQWVNHILSNTTADENWRPLPFQPATTERYVWMGSRSKDLNME
ncbi:hypothetical protein GCM10010916_16990 [Paenibacillus abyssi]|uniref:Gfo/Idh/MocA-like oxidoreductase N-terminal domain-containing protein n=2 Tax=Paenibacillus abyssi TaxID=1340531 RepID=A0A917FTH6_9BACL|nr:hypothetical protein GCM10010916_16990 [Paenibacillus abyssi]